MGSNGRNTARLETRPQRARTFRWSWRLVTVAGIDVHIHGTFLLLIALVALGELLAGHGLTAMARGTLLILAIFTTVVLHEFGHALAARRFGVRTLDITLLPIGGIARLERIPEKPSQQLEIALAGPAVNVAIAMGLFGLARLFQVPAGIEVLRDSSGPFLTQLMWINVFLAVFNLIPGYPMDGGRVLRALLAMRMAPERATQIAARVGQGVAVIFGLVGLFANPLLVVIAMFVWLSAQAEHSVSRAKVALAGVAVRQAMITDFRTLSPHDPLSRAADLTLTGYQQDFPVTDGALPVGVLTRGDLLRGLAARYPNLEVKQVMQNEFETAGPTDALSDALNRLHQGGARMLMVIESERLVGIVTGKNIEELMALRAAGRQVEA